MNAILSLAEEKEILSWHIAPATGRSRQLLDALLEYYPHPAEKEMLETRLSFTGKHSFRSVLRNAKIFIEIHSRNDADSNQCYYSLDDSCIRIAKMNLIMNQLSVR